MASGLRDPRIISPGVTGTAARNTRNTGPLRTQETGRAAAFASRVDVRMRMSLDRLSRAGEPLPGLKLGAQARHGLTVQLTHARLGHTHHPPHLAHIHLLPPLHAHPLPLSFPPIS